MTNELTRRDNLSNGRVDGLDSAGTGHDGPGGPYDASLIDPREIQSQHAASVRASTENPPRSTGFPRSSIEVYDTKQPNVFSPGDLDDPNRAGPPRMSVDIPAHERAWVDLPSPTRRSLAGRKSVSGATSMHSVRVSDLGPWVLRHHKRGLIHAIRLNDRKHGFQLLRTRTKRKSKSSVGQDGESPEREASYRINLAELQRMRLRKLQCNLVKHVVDLRYHDREPPGWEDDLQNCIASVKAIQDYDYMIKCSQSSRDPFLVTRERSIDDWVLQQALDGIQTKPDDFGAPIPVAGPWEDDSQPIGPTRNVHVAKTWMKGFKERLAIAAVGGFFLIGPMWLMVLHNTLYTCLVSTTVFVMAFGVIMAWSLGDSKDVMAGTAAYAAVLVVFVGLGNANTGNT